MIITLQYQYFTRLVDLNGDKSTNVLYIQMQIGFILKLVFNEDLIIQIFVKINYPNFVGSELSMFQSPVLCHVNNSVCEFSMFLQWAQHVCVFLCVFIASHCCM